jgi:Zinc carboxypeptidase/Penicillin-insensitive murein endopeptidase
VLPVRLRAGVWAAAVLAFGVPGLDAGERTEAKVRRLAAGGVSIRVPMGWKAIDRRLTPCVDPAERLAVASSALDSGASLPDDGVLVVLMERREKASVRVELQQMTARPARFRSPGPPTPLACCAAVSGPGWLFPFADGGRTFYAYVFVGRGAGEEARRRALAVLDSVQVEPRKRPIIWRRSRATGLWHAGELARGVQLPEEGAHFFTWDPIRKRAPNRPWRRWGTDRLVRTVQRVLSEYAEAHPNAPRVGVGDLSRPNGGDFGPRYGWPGHASHQNGLDVDLYYPRLDRTERAPRRVKDIDLRLSQDLVDRFVAEGATKVFVGLGTPLRGPRDIVVQLPMHDNHLHVRLPLVVSERAIIGRSVRGRPIKAYRLGTPRLARRVLVVGNIHGDEPEGLKVTQRLIARARGHGASLWVVPTLNPDGLAAGTRHNARGVDLNRNFPSEWDATLGVSGAKPLSEPEARAAARLIRRLRPAVTIWFHQPQHLVRAGGRRSVGVARRYARLTGARFRDLPSPPGSAPGWQNRRMKARSFVVELRPGQIPEENADLHARAVVAIARSP